LQSAQNRVALVDPNITQRPVAPVKLAWSASPKWQ